MRIVESKEFPGFFVHVSGDIEEERRHEIEMPSPQVLELRNVVEKLQGNKSPLAEQSACVEDYLDRDIREMFIKKIDPKFLEFVRLRGERAQSSGIGVLIAHGTTGEDGMTWLYQDGNRFIPVQRWIVRQDRKYSALLLVVCNEGHHNVLARHTPVFIPDDVVEHGFITTQDYHYTLLLPGGEEVDNGNIDWYLKNVSVM